MARHKSDWSELYPEILTTIAQKLQTRYDVINFRSVCKNWLSIIPLVPNHLPYLSPDFPYDFSNPFPKLSHFDSNSPKQIVVTSTFLVCPPQNPNPNVPSKPWLVTVEESRHGKLFFRRPLARESLGLDMPRHLSSLDLSEFNVREICRGYTLGGDCVPTNSKVVLFYNPGNVLNSVDDCYALVLDGRGRLAFLRLENEIASRSLTCGRVSCFDDIVNYKGAIWAINRKGRAYFIPYDDDPECLRLNLYAKDVANLGDVGHSRKRLMESSEGLYLVVMIPQCQKVKFCIYKLDEAERKWSEVKSLDGRILFVTPDYCFFGLVEDFPGLRGDCIVFSQGNFTTYKSDCDEDFFEDAPMTLRVGVFHLDDGESGLLSNDRGFSEIFLPYWLFPNRYLCGREDNEEDTPEVCSSEETCYVVSAIETAENPTINGQEKYDEGLYVPWAEIPSKILTEIAKHLKTPIDVYRCRAVCKKWRASVPPPQNSNLLSFLLPHKFSRILTPLADAIPSLKYFWPPALVASTVYLIQPSTESVGPSNSWLVTVEEVSPGKLFLRTPLRRFAIEKFPDNFPKVWDLSNFHVSEIGREYNFRDPSNPRELFNWFDKFSFSNSHKVVLYRGSVGTSATMDDTSVLVWYDVGKLVSFRLRDNNWFVVHYGFVTNFDDVVDYKGKIYAIDHRGRAYVINCNSSTVSRIVSEAIVRGACPEKQKRLVASDMELYLLVRNSPDEKIFFNVYRMNEEHNKWEEVNSLDGKILFVTSTSCFLASAQDFPRWKGDCIVFPEDSQPTHMGGTHPDMRFFSRVDKELRIGVFYLGDNDAKLIQSYRGYSDLFWPPPLWLQLAKCKSRNEPDLVDVPCVDSQQEQTSSTTAQQEEAAESETKSLVVLPVQDSEAAGASKTIEVSVRPELGEILQKIWYKHGNITAQSPVSSNREAVSQALESLAEAVLILKTTSWMSLNESQAEILRATLSDLEQKQFRVNWLALLVKKALLFQICLPLLESLRKTRAELQKIKRELPEAGLTDAELESVKKRITDNVRKLRSRVLEMQRGNDARIKYLEGVVQVLGPIDTESCIGEGIFLPHIVYAAF